MTDVKNIRIEDFDYPLPDERIALHPLEQRDACKLLVANSSGKITHSVFSDLPILLRPDTLIVANETKVIRARLEFVKETGARIEIFLLEPYSPHEYVKSFASTHNCSWNCLVGNKKRWKDGSLVKEIMAGERSVKLSATLVDPENNIVRFSWDDQRLSFAEIVEMAGNIPIPPYLKRESEESDLRDYQTVYSHTEGSVAAPTAGLHFTPELIRQLKQYGNEFTTVTLHVGAGTFQPVKSEEIGDHPMHSEWISVSRHTLRRLISAMENGRDILAVGTTSVRTLESLPYFGVLSAQDNSGETEPRASLPEVTQWMPYDDRYRNIDTLRSLRHLLKYLEANGLENLEATTSIMIAPGFRWRIVNRLITNFHQPKSTLLLLVSSFLGENRWRGIYDEALANDYRFLSYGDACLFSRGGQPVELPLAKSMVLRAATINAVDEAIDRKTRNTQSLCGGVMCDDSEYFVKALERVFESVGKDETGIYIGEGAAPLRFLTAFAASLPGANIKITCAPGLRKRPIKPLIDALLAMNAEIVFNDSPDDWYITIKGRRLTGDDIKVDSSFTSQFLSALLLASPLWEGNGYANLRNEVERRISGSHNQVTVSRPYLEMTLRMMENPAHAPEPDWSGAAFFYEYALIAKREVCIARLTPPEESFQGDSAVCDLYAMLGVNTKFPHNEMYENRDEERSVSKEALLTFDATAFEIIRNCGTFEFDFSDYPDMVPSVAVALCYCRVPFIFHGVGHLRYKETDRLFALQSILTRLGYELGIEEEKLVFNGEFRPMQEFPIDIDPFGDHRMAMAFYPLELLGMVKIEDKAVVSKSFPDYYLQFKNLI